ncbi:hypothetical protein MNBD_GAMMA26-1132 [hydrothermal vent metagenome]|uniref:Lipoprotein n=1 Tax=hydrothermal vent metagenome TaxID=652676 RepID=A0A3B1AUG5_9ZZZZ
MRKHLLTLLAVLLLTSCGFAPDKPEVQRLLNEALGIDCPSEFSIIKNYNARVMDDYLEAVIIEFTSSGYDAFTKQINLEKWQQNNNEYSYSKQLDNRYRATVVLNTENYRVIYERLHQ